ncbi:MAG: Asp-tRNA(Asn)/Glu-tRNA(Gln) amidotransferase GatCAB subunit C [Epsilonproteobacteria bacterium]|nr:Asp-tRNA(Asn)/Glu-tRNA(Gln) amidotransferase GatCAB subunit C [Campylobacterota bacterium]NPA63944.1 Asp-tRNA(Asn)/Glu-tRNA(Gln) amidotransferase subunit GatC [Campylobacterota bacterium]
MQKIDSSLLHKLENLSMIEVEDEEKVLEELNRFLEFVEILKELNVEGCEATFNPLQASAPLRRDEPSSQIQISQAILERAPKSADNFFIVPKIIE